MKILKNLRIAHKLGVVGIVVCIPIAGLLFLLVEARGIRIDLTEREIAGVEYLKPLRAMFEHVPQHQGAVDVLPGGDESAEEQLPRIARLVDGDVSAIDAADQRFGKRLGTTGRWQALKRRWRGIKRSHQGMTGPGRFRGPCEADGRHPGLDAVRGGSIGPFGRSEPGHPLPDGGCRSQSSRDR